MLQPIISLVAAITMLLSGANTPQEQLQLLFQSGLMLRLHVVAHDDTPEMQRIKLCVRDAVRECYQQNRPQESATMLANTQAILPLLEAAARDRAAAEGFAGSVEAELGMFSFDELPLVHNSVPAGEYPALIIRLGEAQGHNWWGMIDPEASLWLARLPESTEGDLLWDWSFSGFLKALFHHVLPKLPVKEALPDAIQV